MNKHRGVYQFTSRLFEDYTWFMICFWVKKGFEYVSEWHYELMTQF